MPRPPATIRLDDAIAALQALVDSPQLSPEVPADGRVHRIVSPVPVYWARCPDCKTGHGFPSFGEEAGTRRAQEWLDSHQRAYCPMKGRRSA